MEIKKQRLIIINDPKSDKLITYIYSRPNKAGKVYKMKVYLELTFEQSIKIKQLMISNNVNYIGLEISGNLLVALTDTNEFKHLYMGEVKIYE